MEQQKGRGRGQGRGRARGRAPRDEDARDPGQNPPRPPGAAAGTPPPRVPPGFAPHGESFTPPQDPPSGARPRDTNNNGFPSLRSPQRAQNPTTSQWQPTPPSASHDQNGPRPRQGPPSQQQNNQRPNHYQQPPQSQQPYSQPPRQPYRQLPPTPQQQQPPRQQQQQHPPRQQQQSLQQLPQQPQESLSSEVAPSSLDDRLRNLSLQQGPPAPSGAARGAVQARGEGRPSGPIAKAIERLRAYDPEDRPLAIGRGKDALKECASLVPVKILGPQERKVFDGKDKAVKDADWWAPCPEVYTNAYGVSTVFGQFTLFHYVVEFFPNQDSKRTRIQLVKNFVQPQMNSMPMDFDGMNGWSRHNIGQDEITIVGTDRNGSNVTIKVRRRKELPSDSPTTRQMVITSH